jgi:hypothetical protein
MKNTPFFAAWSARLNPMGSRTAQAVREVRAYTLSELEKCFGRWIPPELFPKAVSKENSRDHHYTRQRTFWCMLWQAFHPHASGRKVVRQLQALFRLEGGPLISEEDGAYCRARARLPLSQFPIALAATAKAADQLAPPTTFLQGRPAKAADGSALTLLADTPKNRQAYPPLQCPDKPSFPMMRIVVFFSLLSGAIFAVAQGNLGISELSLLSSLLSHLHSGDILLGDRGFGNYPLISFLKETLKIDFIGRTTRRIDGRRRVKRLGSKDWLISWKKGSNPSPWLSALQWAGLPLEMNLRAVKGSCYRKGYRVRQVTVVTTLLDPQLYPAAEILEAYRRRWRLEMCLNDLKTTLEMEALRSLIAHNLIRCTMAQAASEHQVPLERISFKGTLDALGEFSEAIAKARSKKKRQEIWTELLRSLAADLVPERPGRREPRAVKRKKNKYPRLNVPRHKFRDHPKRNVRRTNARLRKLGLM